MEPLTLIICFIVLRMLTAKSTKAEYEKAEYKLYANNKAESEKFLMDQYQQYKSQ